MKGKYDFSVFFCVVSSLCITSNNFKNEDTVNWALCDFYVLFIKRGANVTLFLWKGCQLQKCWQSFVYTEQF